jgi:spermidine dehydrogenase
MDRPITRRDFLDGVGIAVTGSLLGSSWLAGCSSSESAPAMEVDDYPPARTGMRGSHDGTFEVAHNLRDGRLRKRLGTPTDTGEVYDLVVVGGGLSGLAAAYFFRKEQGPQSKILILDNHEDFGGHATRNEFRSGDRTLLMNGGTAYIEDLALYDEPSQALLRELGIDVERSLEFEDVELYASLGLGRGVFFDKETFGVDRLVTGEGELGWREFFAKTPLSERARNDLARLHEERVDYLPGLSLEEKKVVLQRMTYRDFLTDVVGVHEDALPYLQTLPMYWAIGIDALPAWNGLISGYPGHQGMGLPEWVFRGAYFRFPDGNASIARLLVRSLIPGVAPGNSMEDIVTARFDYARLDREESPVRLRLESTAIRVRNVPDERKPEAVEITYVRGGVAQQVRGRSCVLACYNMMVPHLCPELPGPQREALSCALKAPLVVTNVLIRDWKSFERLGLESAYCPGSYHISVGLGDPVSMGGYRCPRTPDEPMVVQLSRIPLKPGLPAPEQWKAGRKAWAPFETYERKVRDQLGRMLSAGGFDPARDIEAITVNRWSHGYAFGYDPATKEVYWLTDWPEEKRTWLRARRPFGRIAIANSDAGANAMTETAMGEARRAVREILS